MLWAHCAAAPGSSGIDVANLPIRADTGVAADVLPTHPSTCHIPLSPAAACLPTPTPSSSPHGRPSAVPKGKAAVPVATDGKLGPSTLESKRALLERLQLSERSLEVRRVAFCMALR